MAMVVPYKANEGNMSNPRDASFSSYLDANERDFVRNLAKSVHSLSPAREASSRRVSLERNQIPRNELGVFGAERYFNEKLDHDTKKSASRKLDEAGRSRHRQMIKEKRGDRVFEKKSPKSITSSSSSLKSPTPSFKSEGSWNSQIGFLLPKKTNVGLRIFSGFQCKGSCFDKKSVYTANDHQVVIQSPKHYQQNNDHRKKRLSPQEQFAFPIIDTASPKHNYNKSKIMQDHQQQPRKSLEVFGIHQLGKQDIEQNLQRKFSILAWDAIPNSSPNTPLSFPFPSTKKSSTNSIDQKDEYVEIDAMSDASSDLFEIANLSGIAPSESSIEWSVVTASAAEFSMISNDLDDEKIKFGKKMVVDNNTKVPRNSPASGILLGCRNHKAVDVIGNHNTPNDNNASYRRNNEKFCKFVAKDSSPDIAPSTPSRKSYALAYA